MPRTHVGRRPPRRPVRPAGRGEKNNDRIRVRNRRYKIKRMTLQPRNIDVRHNGRVIEEWSLEGKHYIQALEGEGSIECKYICL